MTESIQIIMMFCITIIAVIGIISAVICYSRDRIKFNIKAKGTLPNQSTGEFGIEVDKEDEQNNR